MPDVQCIRLFRLIFPVALLLVVAGPAAAQYHQKNLVSDIPGLALRTNPQLINPWGITFGPGGPFWISDNGTGFSSVLRSNGLPFPKAASPLVVTIPPPAGSPAGTTAAPTGVVFNPTMDFAVTEGNNSGPSLFIFATEDGTISGWNFGVDPTHAILAVDRSGVGPGAVYKGLALGGSSGQNFIYATNFRFGEVEMFDAHFNLVTSFTDPTLASNCPLPGQCFAPFGIRNIGGKLFVTFALQDAAKHDDVAGAGNGFVDVFDSAGNLLGRFASQGALNSPWGLALAPGNFGPFSNALLVGDFGDGHINAFDSNTGAFLGQLQDAHGNPIVIDGLWGLTFGNGGLAGDLNSLFFTAGINDEADGLFGRIEPE